MRNSFLLVLFLVLTLFINVSAKKNAKTPQNSQFESGFITPADSLQTSIYWYWLSDNISEDGVIKDLYSMKKAGINRAFVGNIGLNDVPYGKIKMLSEEWWQIIHAALKTATKLNIEIGIFNSPGWSQSGGPWVKAENAMRYLTSTELLVKGPKKFSQKLENPIKPFQDVKVIAYPAPKDFQGVLNEKNASISSSPNVEDLSSLFDENKSTGVTMNEGEELTIYFQAKESFTARSIIIQTLEIPITASAILQVKEENGNYVTVKEFEIMRQREDLSVGFLPYAPVYVSFPTVMGTQFKLVVKNKQASDWWISPKKSLSGLAEVKLTSTPRVDSYAEKTLAKMHPSPLPLWKEYQWAAQLEVDDKATVIDGSKVIDISKNMTVEGTLNWDVPAGNWIIMRTCMTPTGTKNSPASPESTGYETDKMSKKHIEKHFQGHIGEILKRIPEGDRKTFKVVVADSYETGSQNFTDDFLELFSRKYGYDALPYLPAYQGLVVNSQLASDRFLWDMRRMVADKVAYDYVGGLRDVSHKNGLSIWLENYGHWGFPSEFLMYGGQSDEIGGEFWSEGELGNIECRAATSCGHIYGKTKISAESFTCGGNAFGRYPATIKQRGDRFFAEGINNTLLHVYISQPYED
ncbi:MAG: glycosyl hydrolase, partial [Paludibacter sp.]